MRALPRTKGETLAAGKPLRMHRVLLQDKKRLRSGGAYRPAPEGDRYLRAVAPSLLSEDAQRLPFSGTALGCLLPELLSDALNGDHVLQRDVILRHCAAPHVDARKIANRSRQSVTLTLK